MHKVAMNVLVGNGIFEIYIGADGKIHIRWILPDPPPDLLEELRAVAVVLNEASQLKNRSTAEKFQQFCRDASRFSRKRTLWNRGACRSGRPRFVNCLPDVKTPPLSLRGRDLPPVSLKCSATYPGHEF